MEDKIPNEREISKTELWQRIEASRTIQEQHRQEIDTRIDEVTEKLKYEFDVAVEKAKAEILFSDRKLISDTRDAFAKAIAEIAPLKTDLEQQVKAFKADMEYKVRELKESIPMMVHKDAASLVSDITMRVNRNGEDIEIARAEFNRALSNFQLEIKAKLDTANQKFDAVMGKLRLILKDL